MTPYKKTGYTLDYLLAITLLYFSLFTCKVFAQQADTLIVKGEKVIIVTAKYPLKVVIDPGHGGKDTGKPRGHENMKHEKELNLEIALKLGSYIEERIKNVTVIYTRKTDVFVSLDERVEIANSNNADFFISIHCNSTPQKHVQGTQTHIQSHSFKSSKKLAMLIEEQFSQRAGRNSRGVKARNDRGFNFQVLQYTEMPGVLVEAGFMSNPTEEVFLNSEKGQDLIASAIYRAFRTFVVAHPKPTPEPRRPYYRVQIMASPNRDEVNKAEFEKLQMRVDEIGNTDSTTTAYKYYVGREYNKKVAERLAERIQTLGFKDAFVVKFD